MLSYLMMRPVRYYHRTGSQWITGGFSNILAFWWLHFQEMVWLKILMWSHDQDWMLWVWPWALISEHIFFVKSSNRLILDILTGWDRVETPISQVPRLSGIRNLQYRHVLSILKLLSFCGDSNNNVIILHRKDIHSTLNAVIDTTPSLMV
jgi:hypothetical protein